MPKPDAATITRGIFGVAEQTLAAGIVHRNEIAPYAARARKAKNTAARGVVFNELLAFLADRMANVTGQLQRLGEKAN